MAATRPYVTTVGTQRIGIRLPATYESLAPSLGLQLASEANPADLPGDVPGLLKSGILVRICISYGTVTNRKVARLLCERAKLGTALSSLPRAQFKGQPILTAYIPRNSRLG